MEDKRQLNVIMYIRKNDLDDLAAISELCKGGWLILYMEETDECKLQHHKIKVILVKHV